MKMFDKKWKANQMKVWDRWVKRSNAHLSRRWMKMLIVWSGSYSKTLCCISLESRGSAVVELTCLNNLKCYAVRFFKSLTAFQMYFYIPQTRQQPIATQCDRRLTARSSMLTSEQTKLGIRNEIVNIQTIKGFFLIPRWKRRAIQ